MAMLTRGGLYLGLPAGTTEPQTFPTNREPRPGWHDMNLPCVRRRQCRPPRVVREGPGPPPR
jgi:hypothetical protein